MLDRLHEIQKATFPNLKSGSVFIKVEDRNWLFSTVKQQYEDLEKAKKEIRELKAKNRYRKFIEIATENLEMASEIKQLKEQLEGRETIGNSV